MPERLRRRRVLVVTGARSEYGLLEPVYDALLAAGVDAQLAVTGVHLLAEHGHTVDEIRACGRPIAFEIPFYEDTPISDGDVPGAIARGVSGIDAALATLGDDPITLVLGDRAEALAGALAAYARGGAVAHIHGGEKTDSGHTDEGFRHAITRWAHLHFAATETAAARLRAMGEEEWRVHRVGAPGLDPIVRDRERLAARSPELLEKLGLPGDSLAMFVFHPDRLGQERAGNTARAIFDVLLARERLGIVAIHPNSDPGSTAIGSAIETAAADHPERVRSFRSLPRAEYLTLLAGARVLIGNSSSAIIEAPSLGLPAINVGERNREREHGANVLFVEPQHAAISEALERVLEDEAWIGECRTAPSPYGDGRAAERIARILRDVELDRRFFRKRITI